MFGFRMWTVKYFRKRRSARTEEEESASVVAWLGGRGGAHGALQPGMRSRNMDRKLYAGSVWCHERTLCSP